MNKYSSNSTAAPSSKNLMTPNLNSFQKQIEVESAGPPRVYFNGKFLAASPTGVHRVAEELIAATDRRLDADPSLTATFDFRLVSPKNTRRVPAFSHIFGTRAGLFTWIPWEQLDLPRLAADGISVNLCNLGPLATRHAITMIHDAQVYSAPASYSAAFRLWYKTIQPWLGRRHNRILTVSHFSKTELVRYGVAPADKISVVHNGCDHVLRIPPDMQSAARHGLDGTPYVLALSNTQHHKNIRVLLEAFRMPEMAAIKLALFGSATRADFEAKGFTVPENVQFLGRISDGELAALMAGAVAFACPSLTEGFGLPPLEAMILGCPAIIAPCGALPEVCGGNALIADPYSAPEWAAQILKLAGDETLRDDMRTRGYRQASQFTWDNAARSLLENIAEVCQVSLPKPTLLPLAAETVRISLVMTTLNRYDEVRAFLEALVAGKDQDLEVIIVDQNDTIDLAPIFEDNWPFTIIHKRVPDIRGSSRGRNVGIGLATGDIICFPDDDCTYPPRLLGDVIRLFAQRKADIICGRPADENGQSINGRFAARPHWVRKNQVFTTQTEWLLFFRREALALAGKFDEDIGLGASTPWQSAEGQDLTLNALERGLKVYYDPAIIGYHPKYNIVKPDDAMLERAHKYGRGMGYVFGKHRFSILILAKILLRPLFGAVLFTSRFDFLRAKYYMLSAIGRFEGYLGGRKYAKVIRA